MYNIPDIVLAVFVGSAMLVITVAIAARIGFKPLFESWLRLRQGAAMEDAKILQDRRITLLETELQAMQETLQKLVDAEEFRRQLDASQRGLEAVPGGDSARGRALGA